ncbi:MAG: acetylornithine transaminase [Mariprofundaceae bacterium]|nr:acetylornithine transaminase [Mariprofundaceae bacterium]
MNHIMNTYGRPPLTLLRGKGSRVWDDQNNEYLDFVAGIAVNTLGHAHPRLVQTIAQQAATMLHCSNLYHIPKQIELAERLCQLSQLDRAFFCNSGAEANEAALKLARKYFYDQGVNRFEVITATQSFHGRTIQTIAATGQDKVKVGFEPLPIGFKHIPLNDIHALTQAIDKHTAAILLEPLQGEGGVNLATPAYLQAVRALCDQHGILLILDEVQTGMGRTGSMFAFEQANIQPDILSLAKGLGGGVPIGAMLTKETVASALSPGTHGSTFGGNPLSCAAALTVLTVIEEDHLLENVCERGQQLRQGLEHLKPRFDCIDEVRGQGLLLGLACNKPVAPLIECCRQHGLLVLAAGPNVVRFLPPLNINTSDINEALLLLEKSLNEVTT